MKKRLLILNKMLKPDTGGVEEVVEQHRRILASRFEVTAWGAKSTEQSSSKETERTEDDYGTQVRFRSFFQVAALPVSISYIIEYFRRVREFDIVELHLPFPIGALLCLLFPPKKLVIAWHSDLLRPAILKPLITGIDKRLIRSADTIICTSNNLLRNSDTISGHLHKSTIVPIHSTPTEKSKKPSEIGESQAPFILFFGRLSYYKGIDVLADAINLYEGKWRFVIAGKGDLSARLRTQLDRPNVLLLNRAISEPEKSWLFENCDALVFPSQHKTEAFGIVQLEAMSRSKPVINTALPTGVPEVARDGLEGLTINLQSPDELATAFKKLENSNLREKLGENAQVRATSVYDESVIGEQLLEAFIELDKPK